MGSCDTKGKIHYSLIFKCFLVKYQKKPNKKATLAGG